MNLNCAPYFKSLIYLLLVVVINMHQNWAEEEQTINLDAKMIRDAIADVLRSGDGVSGGSSQSDDGYAEAAQEYLEHVQTVLADAVSPSELYIREQLADLETLVQLLDQLHRRKLSHNSALRLAARLLKGPSKDLVLPTMTETAADTDEFPFENNPTIQLINEAAEEIRRFLAGGKADSGDESSKSDASVSMVTDRLKGYIEDAKIAQPIKEFLDGVLDRTLELEGRKVRFNVEFPDAKNGDAQQPDSSKTSSSIGEPKVTRLSDTDDSESDENRDDKDSASKYSEPGSTTKSSTKTSSSAEDDDGRNLFDQVLSRKAAESIAEALAKDANDSAKDGVVKSDSALLRIEHLRMRNYQPAGLEAMLEAIEACL